jgi:hypothetical protein
MSIPLKKCGVVELRGFSDSRGHLVFIEGGNDIPFAIKRVYYIYRVPSEADRGGHAHKTLRQLVIPVYGSFEVTLDDGFRKSTYTMSDPRYGLYICPITWREIRNFSQDAVCLVLASDHHDEGDYYRNYQCFLEAVKEQGSDI